MLDGYLTAIVIGPCSILPDEWFVDLLGDRGRIASAAGKTLTAMTATAARFNVISDGLATAPKRHAPIWPELKFGTDLTDKGTKAERRKPHFAARPVFPTILS